MPKCDAKTGRSLVCSSSTAAEEEEQATLEVLVPGVPGLELSVGDFS